LDRPLIAAIRYTRSLRNRKGRQLHTAAQSNQSPAKPSSPQFSSCRPPVDLVEPCLDCKVFVNDAEEVYLMRVILKIAP
jgi:hypothetical protein